MNQYSKEEMTKMLGQMTDASDSFYRDAVRIGCHPFIELTGLMNEYIHICRETMEAGKQFPVMSNEWANHLVTQPFQLRYIAEKLECIFGDKIEVRLKK